MPGLFLVWIYIHTKWENILFTGWQWNRNENYILRQMRQFELVMITPLRRFMKFKHVTGSQCNGYHVKKWHTIENTHSKMYPTSTIIHARHFCYHWYCCCGWCSLECVLHIFVISRVKIKCKHVQYAPCLLGFGLICFRFFLFWSGHIIRSYRPTWCIYLYHSGWIYWLWAVRYV